MLTLNVTKYGSISFPVDRKAGERFNFSDMCVSNHKKIVVEFYRKLKIACIVF
jgi:hypothetical protein